MAIARNIGLLVIVTLLQHVKGNNTSTTNTTTKPETNITVALNQTSSANTSLAPSDGTENTTTGTITNAVAQATTKSTINNGTQSTTPQTMNITTGLNSTGAANSTIVTSTASALNSSSSTTSTINTTVSTTFDTIAITDNTTTKIELSTQATSSVSPAATTNVMTSITPAQINITTIVEKVQNKWSESFLNLNFRRTSLNETEASNFTGKHVIETTISYIKSLNASVLKAAIEDNNISDVVTALLQQPQTSLKKNITDRFDEDQTTNLHAFYAVLQWFHDQVLCNVSHFQNLAEAYDPISNSSNDSVASATFDDFIRFILDRALVEPAMLLDAVCNLASQNNVTESTCPEISLGTTTTQPITPSPTPNVQRYEEAWNVVLGRTYSFLNETQKAELENIRSSDMTKALLDYVKNLNQAEVKALVDSNVTRFFSQVLRQSNSARDLIGAEAANEFSADTEKQDIFYLYMNFLTNLMKDEMKFEAVLRAYVGASSRRRKRATACDTETITADGLVCHIITTVGSNTTVLLAGACAEIDQGNDSNCTDLPETATTQGTPVDSGPSTAVIIGAVVGSVAGFLLLMLLGWFIWVRCSASKKAKIMPRDTELESSQQAFVANHDKSRQSTPDDTRSASTNEDNAPSVLGTSSNL